MRVSRLVPLFPVLLAALAACTPNGGPDDVPPGTDGGGPPLPGTDAQLPPGTDGGTTPPATCNPACTGATVCVGGTCTSSLTGVPGIDSVLFGDDSRFNDEVLISQDPDMSWRPSRIYKWRDFVQAVSTMHTRGVGDMRLWLGEPGDPADARTRYALVNLAAFLAQSMKETIKYDACDENNWSTGYPIDSACGQLGQDYAGEGYDCEMACPRDPTMQVTAVTHAAWYGAPGPLFCAPNATINAVTGRSDGRTGVWNIGHDCYPYPASQPGFTESSDHAWTRPECEVYAGQRAGRYDWNGSGGSVEGCCWWGRGVIQTTGRCNFGLLNHYLGAGHLDPGRFPRSGDPLYPDVNFCRDPEAVCASTSHPELKWIAGLFYWMSSVEPYSKEGWEYKAQLRAWVDGGMTGNAFIDAVSGIVNRGCHNPPCATGPVDGLDDRRANFELVLTTMGIR